MQSHKRRRCEEDDGDFDFDRPPSRQRSESLFRRQQELFNAMNMDFNDNDKQQEEDQNFDLELPFDVQGRDVNNDIVSYSSFDSINNNNNNNNNVSTGQDFVDIRHIFRLTRMMKVAMIIEKNIVTKIMTMIAVVRQVVPVIAFLPQVVAVAVVSLLLKQIQ